MAPFDLNDVAVFVRVVDLGGFAKAARELRVPTSTVSRAVARLEESVGTRLMQRTTRSVRATAEGRAFYAEVAPAVAALHRAAHGLDAADRAPRGRLRMTAPHDIAITFLADVVVAFTERHPRVAIDLELTGRKVNLVDEGFDLAIRAGKLTDSSLVARRVGDLEADLYASFDYVKAHGAPATPSDLENHACVLFRAKEGLAEWQLQGPDGDEDVTVRGRIAADDFTFVLAAVLARGGIGLMPRILAAHDVEAGRLLRVLPSYGTPGVGLYIVHPSSRNVPGKVAAFRDFVLEAYARRRLTSAVASSQRTVARGPVPLSTPRR